MIRARDISRIAPMLRHGSYFGDLNPQPALESEPEAENLMFQLVFENNLGLFGSMIDYHIRQRAKLGKQCLMVHFRYALPAVGTPTWDKIKNFHGSASFDSQPNDNNGSPRKKEKDAIIIQKRHKWEIRFWRIHLWERTDVTELYGNRVWIVKEAVQSFSVGNSSTSIQLNHVDPSNPTFSTRLH